MDALTRRELLVLSGTGLAVTAGLGQRSSRAQAPVIRQGYQTNMWGMPTYYLLRSGHLERRGLKVEEFSVPSGNLTMQQMVARQVDLGTYAGQSFLIGHDKGKLVAIAQIEQVGKTARVMGRKDLGVTRVADLRGMRIGNQSGSSTATPSSTSSRRARATWIPASRPTCARTSCRRPKVSSARRRSPPFLT
jgi:ABC-type nitrate/sulfonate/bicarbonate transport system substrate-binding protein